MRTTKIYQLNLARVFADGLGKHFSKSDVVHVNGRPYKVSELVTKFEDHEALVTKSIVARTEWLQLAAQAGAAEIEMQSFVESVSAQVRGRFGLGSQAYNDFGLKERKVTRRSAVTKAQAAEKAVKTRAARQPRAAPAPSEPATPPSPATNGPPAKPA
jgi:hypothetical protein